jgi:peptidoglycan/LPS O-acetylase OafA/YrhL
VPDGSERGAAPVRLGRRLALDGLRGIAVLVVIELHLGLVAGGYVGVDVFFALSGFLITVLLYEEWDRTGQISLRRFCRRRVRRLLPAVLLLVAGFTAVMLVLHPFSGLWPLGRLIAVTLLAANNWVTALVPSHGRVLGALVPTWTLAQEVQFYLLWPLALCVLLRRRTRPGAIVAMLGVAMLVLLGAGVLVRHAYPAYNSYTSPFDRGAELLLGCATAIVWRERRVPAPLRWPVVGWFAAGALVYVLFMAATPGRVWYLTSALLAAVVIVNVLTGPALPPEGASGRWRMGSLLKRLLGARPLPYVGKISYGIYLYHLPIYYLLWTYTPGRSPYFYALIVLPTSCAAAAMSWHFVEAPILRRNRPRKLVVRTVTNWLDRGRRSRTSPRHPRRLSTNRTQAVPD